MTKQKAKTEGEKENGHKQWLLKRDKLLLAAGLMVIAINFIATEYQRAPFHVEYLFVGMTLCGIGLAQGFDRSGKR